MPDAVTPMLARAIDAPPRLGALPGEPVFEPKTDGFRALVFARGDDVRMRSRRGADFSPAFPELAEAAGALARRRAVVLDGELVVPTPVGRGLDFPGLQERARRRGRSAQQAAVTAPASIVLFDVLELDGHSLLSRGYDERRAHLEELAEEVLGDGAWAVSPAVREVEAAEGWLAPGWGEVGIEGYIAKGSAQRYQPGVRGWLKRRARHTTEAVVAGIMGQLAWPSAVLLGRWTPAGELRLVARSTALRSPLRARLASRLREAGAGHPWEGVRFSAAWGTREALAYTPVEPELVAEFSGDAAIDAGRWRHPVRVLRLREDLDMEEVPAAGEDPRRAG